MIRFVRVLFIFLALGASLPAQSNAKKFIELGWDIPDTAYLKEHHEEMQRTTPFDGVILELTATTPDVKRLSTQSMMDPVAWESAWFETARADLQACRWTSWTDNFIRINFTPGKVKWEDDEGWKIFAGKCALVANIARQAGLKGLAIDFEPYGDAIFKYDPGSGNTFARQQEIVRQRGRQWMEALAGEYPGMVLLALFVLDFVPGVGEWDDPDDVLQSAYYGLLPAFYNGMLDAVPPGMTIVDGCESGYYHNGIDEFSRRALSIQSIGGSAIRHIAPENRKKYIAQVQVGFGFYLDMYTNPEGNVFYRGPKEGGTRLDRLEENLFAARETADEYVWIYGEQRRWWKPVSPDGKWEHWEEALPGISATILRIGNPVEAARRFFEREKKNGTLTNLALNADFARSKQEFVEGETNLIEQPADWSTWQHEALGTFSRDPGVGDGSAKASKVRWGCFMQSHPVKPGELYYVSAECRQQGVGIPGLRIRWQDAEHRWTRESDDRPFSFGTQTVFPEDRPLPDGWRRAGGWVRIPEGVAVLQIQLGVRDQGSEADILWFDNVTLVRIGD